MVIDTKFDIGETVYFIEGTRLRKSSIKGIVAKRGFRGLKDKRDSTYYTVSGVADFEQYSEDNLYKTKEDLLNEIE